MKPIFTCMRRCRNVSNYWGVVAPDAVLSVVVESLVALSSCPTVSWALPLLIEVSLPVESAPSDLAPELHEIKTAVAITAINKYFFI